MTPDPIVPAVAHAIQLAVAPVFLLTGIAGLLAVMAARLARVIDRARWFEQSWPALDEHARDLARIELVALERRRHFASWSINLCTVAALLTCLVIVTLFVEEFFGPNLKWLAGVLFSFSMLAIIGGLAMFLREVYLATHSTSIDSARFDNRPRR
jgi:small-conductance mechanosensitive channel